MNKTERATSRSSGVQIERVCIILGILSIISVFLAFWIVIIVMRAGIATYIPGGHEYLYPLFWLLWLLLPLLTIVCGTYAKKAANHQVRRPLVLIGLILGYLSLVFIGTIVLAEIVLFFGSLACSSHSPCS